MSSSRPARRRLPSILLWSAMFLQAVAAAQPDDGSAVADYIEQLRRDGINVIYSDELLTADMRFRELPPDGGPLDRLRGILAPFGLTLTPGPRGAWLVVRSPTEPPPSAPRPARPSFTPSLPQLENVVVTASRYSFSRPTEPSTQRLDSGQLESLPTLGEDALRATHVLPGVTSSGLSSRFNVRGGESDETLLLIDGVRLYDPFHLRGFQSLFSSISSRVLDSVDMHTGGYPVQFGDRMSAVVDMRSATPTEARHHEIAVSTLTTSVLSSGRFAEDRGGWLTSLRRGNLDLLADAAGSDIGQPQYTDFFTTLSFALDSGWSLTGGALLLNDKISLRDEPVAAAGADYDDSYLWLRLDHEPRTGFAASYLLSHSRVGGSRDGFVADPSLAFGTLAEDRKLVVDGLKADWSLALSDKSLLRWGAELERADVRHDVELAADFPAPITVGAVARAGTAADIALDIAGRQQGAYAAWRFRPVERLTAELGLRWDRQSYTDDSQLSPRMHWLLDIGSRSTLRASWGRYFQAQGLDELQAADGVETFFPAQEAEHLVLGFEYLLGRDVVVRVEAYRKEFEQLRPRFENLVNRVSLLPELLPDRISVAPVAGEATGLEVAVDGRSGPWEWWVSAARAEARDLLPQGWRRRSWEESWSAKGGATWSGRRWSLTLAATAHSGWPVTSLELVEGELTAGPLNAERFRSFASLDVKATRRVEHARVDLSWFVEVTNLLNRENPCCVDYSVDYGLSGEPARLEQEFDHWLPIVPSIGFLLEF